VRERISPRMARAIRLVTLDVDGVLTDGGIYMGRTRGGEQLELKRFHITDGLGIKLLGWAGIRVVLVSGRESPATTIRAEELGIECYQDDSARKVPIIEQLLSRHGLGWHEVAFLSDDIADLPVLERVGLPVAVANAVREVKAAAAWVTRRPGGSGAVREFAEALLTARGEWGRLVDGYRRSRLEATDGS